MPKFVRQKSTGRLVYREAGSFEDAKGLKNASKTENIPEADLEVVTLDESNWTAEIATRQDNRKDSDRLDPKVRAILLLAWKWQTGALTVPATPAALKQQFRDEIG